MQEKIIAKAKKWLSNSFDKNTKEKVLWMMKNDTKMLSDCFYKDLVFGTGGMRGIMGVGTNRINKYTLGKATQGLANYLLKMAPEKQHKVVIAYDCRNNSNTLAKTVADILMANGIFVFLFESLRTTPELSFAVRHLKCIAGIVLTASHNPPEYNGYKVYWEDGGQIVPPQDKEIIEEINNIHFEEIRWNKKENLLQIIGKEIDSIFIENSIKNSNLGLFKKDRNHLKIVFTPLHGTSITAIPEALKKMGYQNVFIVKEQEKPDGNFPTVKSPNPEEIASLNLAMDLAKKKDADIVIGTDPDSDRLGIAVKDKKGNLRLLNGNQTMVVMTKFLLEKWKNENKLNGKQFVATTVVSSPMLSKIAEKYGVSCKMSLTGFKWIGKFIKDFPDLEFIGGGEESYGYLVGDFVRDKDAVTATLLACDIATICKKNKSNFYEALEKLYREYGHYYEHLKSLKKEGEKGAKIMEKMMENFRKNPPEKINDEKVKYFYDYLKTQENTTLPKSDLLIFETEKGTRLAVRPSGTEPKIKFYVSVYKVLEKGESLEESTKILKEKAMRILKNFY